MRTGMAIRAVYHQGWTLDEVGWEHFQPQAVEPNLLEAIKARPWSNTMPPIMSSI